MQVEDDVLSRAAANCGEAYRTWAEGLGRPWRGWYDLVVADLGLPVSLPPNHASLRVPLSEPAVDGVVERIRDFFDGSPGGGYQLWSVWPTPDLTQFGFERWSTPMMIRPAGGEPRPAPAELTITAVDDEATGSEASALLSAFGLPSDPDARYITPRLRSETFRFWLGRVEGKAASIAAASVSHGFVGIYAVATAPAFRGRGYGEALTWAATSFRPDLPATLQASPMGLPVYERMGYRTVATFRRWTRERSS